MTEPDFARIGELFYNEVGRKIDITLKGFIKHALFTYEEKNYEERGRATFNYEGDNKSRLGLEVFQRRGFPDLNRIMIRGKVEFEKILRILQGELFAEYKGMRLEPQTGNTQETYANMGVLGIYFSSNPAETGVVKRVVLEQKPAFGERRRLRLEGLILDEKQLKILEEADRVSVSNCFYVCHDVNKDLVGEAVTIVRMPDGHFFTYSMDSNGSGIPQNSFNHLARIFSFVEPDFNKWTFKKFKTKFGAKSLEYD